MNTNIPYKIYLSEDEMPRTWYNVKAHMKGGHEPFMNPATGKPCTKEDLCGVFCEECVDQELNDKDELIEIPEEIRNFYKMYRPSPLVRAYCLEKLLDTPAEIYYKFEGNNTSGSHKLNSAAAQAYYAKKQGLTSVTTETGAGQWGTALAMACAYFGLDLDVYMVKVSYEQKPFRREVIRTYGANVIPSPSMTTAAGRKILEEHPGTGGSLGCAISEAVEKATQTPNCRYVLGSVLDHVLLHQSIIGQECKIALDKYGVQPDLIIGCAGGGPSSGRSARSRSINTACSPISSSAARAAALTSAGSSRPSWGKSSKAKTTSTSSPSSPQAAPPSRAASTPTISAIRRASPPLPRCTRWDAGSCPRPTTRAGCAITA